MLQRREPVTGSPWLLQRHEDHLSATVLTAGQEKADEVLYPMGLEGEEQQIWSQAQECSALPGGMNFFPVCMLTKPWFSLLYNGILIS